MSSGYQGSVYLFHHDDQCWVVKCANDKWLTGWFHRMMLRREALVYEILSGVSGVPISLGMLDNNFLILEFIEGKVLRDVEGKLDQPESFYIKLHKIISEMHALGVAHGDLKRKDNILVTNESKPVVIDFGTALRRDGGFLDHFFFRIISRSDFNAWIKLKYAKNYNAISPEDMKWFRPNSFELTLRILRRFWQIISFRKIRKRWKKH